MITEDTDVTKCNVPTILPVGLPSFEKWAATQQNPSRDRWARVTLENLTASWQSLTHAKQEQLRVEFANVSVGKWRRLVNRWHNR